MITRRRFIGMLAALPLFRPQMREENRKYVIGVDPASSDGSKTTFITAWRDMPTGNLKILKTATIFDGGKEIVIPFIYERKGGREA